MIHVVIGKIWHPFLDSPHRLHSLGSVDATPRAIYAASVRQLQDLILCYRTGYPDVLFTSAASAALAMLVGALLRDVPVPPAMPTIPTPTTPNTTGRRVASIFPLSTVAAQREQQHRLKQRNYEQALIIWRSYFLLCIRCWQDMYTCYPVFRDVVRAHLAQALQGNALSPAEVRRHVAELDQRGAHHYISSSSSSTQDRQQEPQPQQERQGQHETRAQDVGSSATTPARSSKRSEVAKAVKSPGTIKVTRTATELGSRHHVAAPDNSAEAAVDGQARGAQRQAETQPQLHEADETPGVIAGQDNIRHSADNDGAGDNVLADAPHGAGKKTQTSTVAEPPTVATKAPAPENTGTFVSDFDKSSVARDGRSGGVWMHTMAAQLDDLTLFAEFTNNEDLETREV